MKLLWIDLETTGLHPERDAILEVAAFTTTLEAPFQIANDDELDAALPFSLNPDSPLIDPFVCDMHTKNGLWDACRKAHRNLASVESDLLAMVDVGVPREDQTTLAGSSVHFDLAFLRRWMPNLAKHLSHRVYDVSAIALFCRSLGMPKLPRAEAHRALDDVKESFRNARRCAEWLEKIS